MRVGMTANECDPGRARFIAVLRAVREAAETTTGARILDLVVQRTGPVCGRLLRPRLQAERATLNGWTEEAEIGRAHV